MRISCPPTISPCYYGVDTPDQEQLIAAKKTIDEIRDFIGADTLEFLSLENLRRAVTDTSKEFCYACYTGKYPTDIVPVESLVAVG